MKRPPTALNIRVLFPVMLLLMLTVLGSCRNGKKEHVPPNVLFIAIDDLNDWAGYLGGHPDALTPNLDRLAGQSTVFTSAHASATACQPSRNSLLWGLHPVTTGWYENLWNRQELDRVTDSIRKISVALPHYFREQGYRTMVAGKVFHHGPADGTGLEREFWDEILPEYSVSREFRERGNNYGGPFYYPFPAGGSQVIRKLGPGVPGHSLCGGPLDREKDIPGGEMPDEYAARWAIEKLSAGYDTPFFLAIGFVRPHVPYTAPAAFFESFRGKEVQVPRVPGDEMADVPVYGKAMAMGFLPGGDHHAVLKMGSGIWDANRAALGNGIGTGNGNGEDYWTWLVRCYLSCVSFTDHQVGKVLDALEQSPYRDNTIVVLWSDHGQQLGEKKMWRKMCLWEESTRVPLLIKKPGQQGGSEVDAPVSLLDIYPTLVELAGLPGPGNLEGNSLVPLIQHPDTPWDRPVLTSWQYGNFAVRSRDWRYIRYRDGTEELYDHRSDPGEHTNLAGDPGFEEIMAGHRKHIPDTVADRFFKPFQGDQLDGWVALWDSAGIPGWLR